MTQRSALCGTTAIFIALASTVQADVTGADVWNNWKAAAESVGQSLTPGAQSQDGDTLTITDLQISMDVPDLTVSGAIAEITFTDQGDGTVVVAMSPSYTMTMESESDDAEDGSVEISVVQDGMSMIASGDPAAVTYDYMANSMAISVENLIVEDETLDLTAEIILSDVSGKYLVAAGEMTEIDSGLTAGTVDVVFAMKEPDGGSGSVNVSAKVADFVVTAEGALMMMNDPELMAKALADGMNTTTKMTHGAMTYDVDFVDGSDAFKMVGSATGGSFDLAMDADGLGYAAANTGVDIKMSGSEIPLPEIALGIGEIGFSFLMPLTQSDAPGDFGMGFVLADLSVSDMIWGMVDAGGQLPHDPATLIIDLSGKANWLIDIFDPEAQAKMDMEIPGELHALDINEVKLAVAGAELTGTGAFTFNMDDLATFNGMPAPTGKLDLNLTGGNGLMDNLVAMGLLPQDQAMGARMMMGLFATPGEGEDSLMSTIEVDGATGAISANGQRLQ